MEVAGWEAYMLAPNKIEISRLEPDEPLNLGKMLKCIHAAAGVYATISQT